MVKFCNAKLEKMCIYAVAVKRGADIVEHVPCSISYLCYLFIESGGIIECEITGQTRYSADLPQETVQTKSPRLTSEHYQNKKLLLDVPFSEVT